MFGFIGKHQGQIEVESNGLPSTNRFFDFYLGSEIVPVPSQSRGGFMLFDIENVSGTKPDNTQTNTLDSYGIESVPLLVGGWNEASQIGNRLFDETYLPKNATLRGWRYTSSSVLTPATRKYKFVVTDPRIVEVISIVPRTNNQGRTSTNNNGTGTLTLDLNGFENLKNITLNEMWIDTLNFNADSLTKIETIELTELLNLSTLNGKAPASTKKFKMGGITPLNNINNFLSDAVNCEVIQFGHWSPTPNFLNTYDALSGNLDIAHMTNLKELALGLVNLTGVTFPTVPANNWRIFFMWLCNASVASTPDSIFNDALASSNLEFFGIHQSNRLWTKSFTNGDISPSLIGLYLYGNRITGDFTLTNSQTVLKDLRLGISASELNRFANIDLSGLNGGALTTLHLQGVECEDLTLPSGLSSLTTLFGYDNKLDIVTNSDLITKINGYTNLLYLHLGDAGTSGQLSANGLGANPDFSNLINLQQLYLNHCKISGSLYLPDLTGLEAQPWLYLRQLVVRGNTGLTTIENFDGHAKFIQTINIYGCTELEMDFSKVESVAFLTASNCGITHLNLSGMTSTAGISSFSIDNSPNLTTITFPTTEATCKFLDNMTLHACPLLTSIPNHENIVLAGTNKGFFADDCSLNIPFQYGVKNFLPINTLINNNGMSTLNVDATINNIYTNRAKWSSGSKTLNIGGTNNYATGIYQAPSGFSLGISDGTPASAAEQLYVLTNNYEWTITFNAQVIAGVHWSSVSGSYSALWSGVAYGNGIFVAVAKSGAGDRTMYSLDSGATWSMRTSATNYWMWVTYGNGLFVAVGADGSNRVMTSPDGVTWTSRLSAGEFNQWNSVTYGNGLFVAVAGAGFSGQRAMTSPDGTNWTIRNTPADNNWTSVTYGNGLFVAVSSTGSGNRVMTSSNGINWTGQTSAADNAWQGVTYGNGLFVAVANSGTGNRVMTSPDGITWTIRTSAVDNAWKSVTYGNGLFVAVSTTGTATDRVMTSPDGITWTSRSSAGTTNNEWQGVTYGNGQFIAVSHTSSNWVMKSP